MTILFVLHAEADGSSAELVEGGWCGPNACYYIYSDGTLEINGSGEMYNYDDVRAPWYSYRENITKIIIGDGITYLGKWAFLDCEHLKELTIPITLNATTANECCAFAVCYNIEKINFTCGKDGCGVNYSAYEGTDNWYQQTPWYLSRDSLREIDFADGVTHIGSSAFCGLNITKVVLPDSVTSLGNHCFLNCTELTDLTIPVSLNSYGNEKYPAFQGCMAVNSVTITRGNGAPFYYTDGWGNADNTDLAPWNMNHSITKKIVISDDITSLGGYMFYHTNISELTIPITLNNISDGRAIVGCKGIEKITFTPGKNGYEQDYNTYMEDYWYQNTPWYQSRGVLKEIVFEEGIKHIGSNAFRELNITSLVIPDSVTSLGEHTFCNCKKLTELTIPISLKATAWYNYRFPAFEGVSELVKVTFTPGSGYGYNYTAYDTGYSWYQKTPWYQSRGVLKEIVFEEGIKHIGSDAFRELNITSVVIPNSVESLGCHTFYNCSKLTDLTIPITLDSICSERYPAFHGCNAITALRFTAGTDGVGHDYTNYAPSWCTPSHQPDVITFDSGIKYIGTKTLALFSFFGSDGEILQPVAECLSGHVFTKTANGAYSIANASVTTNDLTHIEDTGIKHL